MGNRVSTDQDELLTAWKTAIGKGYLRLALL
jgi:hypothetical protein